MNDVVEVGDHVRLPYGGATLEVLGVGSCGDHDSYKVRLEVGEQWICGLLVGKVDPDNH